MQKQQYKIIISGGGTGGHVFPAIAIANAIKQINPETEILFVGALGRLEMEKVPQAGYKIIGLNISGFQRRLTWQNLIFPFRVLSSYYKSKKILKNFKPDVVVGVGGYASGPVLKAAINMKIPTLIQEQNSYPGVTNKILSKKVNKICVAYEGMEKYFPKEKIVLTGNPVREEVINLDGKRDAALEFFGLQKNKKTVLVIGGSLGARTINERMEANLKLFRNNDIQLIWQTGKTYFQQADTSSKKYTEFGIRSYTFITQMDYAYAAADVIVSRAGAIAISEICLVGKPLILVPSPNVAEDHQTKNALALANHSAAIMVKDEEARQILAQKIIELLNNETLMSKLSENIVKFAHKNASAHIADVVLSLIKDRKTHD